MSVWPWYAGARAGIAKCRDVCLRVLPVEGEECQVPGLDDVCLFVHVMCVAWSGVLLQLLCGGLRCHACEAVRGP